MRLLSAVLLLCVASAATAQADVRSTGRAALAALDACIPQLDASLDVGYERISARCPQLTRSLEKSSWARWLPRDWKQPHNDLSAGSLAELRALVARELARPARGVSRPDVAGLDVVLSRLEPDIRKDRGLLGRFRDWVRTLVERNQNEANASWLDRMIQRHGRSRAFVQIVTYVSLALIFALVALIVVNELRAVGFGRGRARASAVEASRARRARRHLSWGDIERAPAADRPRLLLQLVIARLTDTKRLPPAGAYTVRELTHAARLDDAADRERLADLAVTAEGARYAAAALAPEVVGAAIESGRELLEKLEHAA